jgi:hypothetical protein
MNSDFHLFGDGLSKPTIGYSRFWIVDSVFNSHPYYRAACRALAFKNASLGKKKLEL